MSKVLIPVLIVAIMSALMSYYNVGGSTIETTESLTYEPMEVSTHETTAVESPIHIYDSLEDMETSTEIIEAPTEEVETTVEEPSEPKEWPLTRGEIELIALVTMAEAEGEPELGKRLVIDTILNRMDSAYFPDTVAGVVYQEDQFTSVWNGRIDRCYVRDDICQLVIEELDSRYNYDVVFFRTDYYSTYGQPLFQVGNHYFSSSDY